MRADRAPLTSRQRTGAIVAGAIAMPILVAGLGLAAIAVALLAIGLAFGRLFLGAEQSATTDLYADLVTAVDIGAGLIGAVLPILIAFIIGRRFLVAFGIERAAATTWVSLAVSLVSLAAVAAGLYGFVVASVGDRYGIFVFESPTPLVITLSMVAELLASCIVGLFAWWLVAHLLRPVATTPPAS